MGDLAGFLPNNTFSRAELSENGRIQNIHYGDVLIKFGEVLDVANEQLPFVAKTKKINKISELKLENGDIVFADAAEDKTVGKCTELFNIIDKIVISGLHTIPCRPQIAFATAYLGYFFNSPCYRTQLLPLMQGIKVLSLSKTALLQTDIFYPKDQSEQARIGTFFRHLDRLITLHQCNCNMATRPCEWSSGLRAIAWEQRKLGDLAGFLPNNTFSRAELSENGRIQNIHYGDVLIKFGEVLDVANEQLPFVAKTKKINKISELKLENGDIVFADAAEDKTVGKCTELFNIIDKIVISGLHTIPCRPQIAFATAYLGYFFNSPCYRTQLLPLMQGIKVLSLSKTALLQTDIFYPKDQSEQARIGTFFRHLDRLITLHQRKHILLT